MFTSQRPSSLALPEQPVIIKVPRRCLPIFRLLTVPVIRGMVRNARLTSRLFAMYRFVNVCTIASQVFRKSSPRVRKS